MYAVAFIFSKNINHFLKNNIYMYILKLIQSYKNPVEFFLQ